MNCREIFNEKKESIVRIDEFIKFLKDRFYYYDKYDNSYYRLNALLNKEKELYCSLSKIDPNNLFKKLKDTRRQIAFEILEIKNKNTNVIEEINPIFKNIISDKLLDENMSSIKKELYKKLKYLSSDLLDHRINSVNKIKEILEETFFNCDCNGSAQAKILEILSNIKNDEEILKTKQSLEKIFKKELKKEMVKERFSDEFLKRKKEELLNNEIIKIKNELFFNKHFEYYLTNSYEQKNIKDHLNALLKFHPLILSCISLVGVICYFAYFGLFIGYFPVLSGSEIFYVGALLFFVVGIFTSFIILPIIFYPVHIKSSLKYKTYGKYLSLLLLVLSFPIALLIAFIVNILFYIDKEEILFVFLVALAFSYVLSCIAMWIKEKNKRLIVGLIAVVFIISIFLYNPQITTISIFIIICITYILFALGVLYFCEAIYQDGTHKEVSLFSIFLIPIVVFFYSVNDIANKFEATNVEYKYLSIEKSALGVLPKEIDDISKISPFENRIVLSYTNNTLSIKDNNNYLNLSISPRYLSFFYQNRELKGLEKASNIIYRNNMLYCDIYENAIYKKAIQKGGITVKMKEKEHITYTEQHGDTIWLHNIKAISTLGKFYYLETKDGVRFELDSSKIISRAKE